MRSVKIALIFCAFALFIIACDTNKTASTPTPAATPASTNATPARPRLPPTPVDELAEARATYSQTCARCHKEDGTGGPYEVEGAKRKAPSLREGHATKHTDEQLARKITNGGDGMPSFGKRLAPERINALVHFVRVEFQGQK